ncbi:MAG TPA: DinB family protein [Bryobacteraceae bacterium]|nr:DinB family protein [Bryobacteraceae bacterium]
MNRIFAVTLIASFSSAAALAQNAQNPFSADAKQSYTGIKNTLLKAADKMPEENYSFRTTQQVRTYGEIIAHIADVQMTLCGIAKGEQTKPVSAGKTSKADLTAALKQSFDYCDAVYNSMTDAEGASKVTMFGRQMTKLGVLNFNAMHDNEMYGTMVAYLRIKGLVPPSSEGRP